MASLDSSMWEASLPSSKRLRVESKPALDLPCNENVGCDPKGLVGKKLKVYWPIDEAGHEGHIKSYNNISGRHAILYDDREEEGLLLAEEKIEWTENENKINLPLHRFRRLRKLSKKGPTNGNTLNEKDDISEDVSEGHVDGCCKWPMHRTGFCLPSKVGVEGSSGMKNDEIERCGFVVEGFEGVPGLQWKQKIEDMTKLGKLSNL